MTTHHDLPDAGRITHTEIDDQLPTRNEKDALQGSSGTPGDTNRYITEVEHDAHTHTESDITDLAHTTDHGALDGLADDDHAQYLNTARHDTTARHGSSVVDHGSIGGLADDDHPQYGALAQAETVTGAWMLPIIRWNTDKDSILKTIFFQAAANTTTNQDIDIEALMGAQNLAYGAIIAVCWYGNGRTYSGNALYLVAGYTDHLDAATYYIHEVCDNAGDASSCALTGSDKTLRVAITNPHPTETKRVFVFILIAHQ